MMSIVAVEVLSKVSQFLIPSMARANFRREQKSSIIKNKNTGVIGVIGVIGQRGFVNFLNLTEIIILKKKKSWQ